MRVMITGGTGFIGSHLCDLLKAHGHDVLLMDIERWWVDELTPNAFIHGTVTDFRLVKDTLLKFAPDEIVHLAGISHTVASALGQRGALEPGVMGLATLQDAIRAVQDLGRKNFLPRISIASSSLLSGMLRPMAGFEWLVSNNETHFCMSDCYHQYCDNKLMMEMLCWSNNYQFKLPFTIFRFGTQYGPRMRPNVVTWYFIRNALLGKPMQIHGDGNQVRQHFYVKDLVEAMVIMLENRHMFQNRVISIVPSYMTSVRTIAETVQVAVPGSTIEYVDSRPIDVKVRQITGSAALEAHGWQPKYTLEAGIIETVEFYKGRMELVRAGFDDRIKEQN